MTVKDSNGLPIIGTAHLAPTTDDATKRTRQRAAVARLVERATTRDELADALESRTLALSLATTDNDKRIAARDGRYREAELLADAWLTYGERAEQSYVVLTAEPKPERIIGCQTRAEWAQVWDDARQAVMHAARFNMLERGIFPAQSGERIAATSFASRDYNDAIASLMGASSTYVLDWSDGLTVADIANVDRARRRKMRAAMLDENGDGGGDAREGYWRERDVTQSPLVYRDGVASAGVDGRQRERDAIKAAARELTRNVNKSRQAAWRQRERERVAAARQAAVIPGMTFTSVS